MPHILIICSNPAEANATISSVSDITPGQTYARALEACRDDLEITIVAPYDGDTLPPLDRFDGVVFTGSSVEWSTDDPRAQPLADAMRRVFDEGLPTLGSCNGLQLAASVLGGSSDASPNGVESGIAKDITMTEAGRGHPFLQGREDGYAAPCIHRDEVRALPDGAVVLAGNAHSGVQAFAYEQDGIRFWGAQYHPEFEPKSHSARMVRIGGMEDAAAADLALSAEDPDAAARLGIRATDMQPQTRMTELRNWLASL
ncbi:MAG: type 1 glutamine amidotransferase [Sulfitobacter sp.]